MLYSISKLADTGLRLQYDELQRLRIRLFNFDLLLGILLPLVALCITYVYSVNDFHTNLTLFLFIFLSSLSFYLNSKYWHDVAAILFLSCNIVGIILASYFFGKATQVHFYLLSISASSFIYQLQNRLTTWGFFSIHLVAFLVIDYLPLDPVFHWDETRIQIIAHANIAIATLFFGGKLVVFAQMFLQMLKQLQDSNALISTTLESTADGIFAFDLQNQVTRYNQKFVDMWQIPQHLMDSGDRLAVAEYAQSMLLHPAPFMDSVARFTTDPEIIKFDILYFRDGRTIERYSQPQWIDDEIVGRVISFRDISDKMEQAKIIQDNVSLLNQKNKELEKYIESNLQLENFAYMASHDLKAPVRTIVSFSQLLKRSAESKLDKSEKDFLSFIIGATHNMQHLIEALLTYARVNTQEQVLTEVPMEDLLDTIRGDLHSLIEEHGAQVQVNGIPNNISADETKLRRLLQNLIQNAIKFHRKDVAPTIKVAGEDKQHYWQFSVSDNGIGIEAEFHEKIFLLFRKLHNQKEYQGTGIGLALCKKIVEQHGGRIWLDSIPGQGTTFYFTIKKAEPNKVDSAS